jgi:hypothetical protein
LRRHLSVDDVLRDDQTLAATDLAPDPLDRGQSHGGDQDAGEQPAHRQRERTTWPTPTAIGGRTRDGGRDATPPRALIGGVGLGHLSILDRSAAVRS